jgi:hypothetical protein
VSESFAPHPYDRRVGRYGAGLARRLIEFSGIAPQADVRVASAEKLPVGDRIRGTR